MALIHMIEEEYPGLWKGWLDEARTVAAGSGAACRVDHTKEDGGLWRDARMTKIAIIDYGLGNLRSVIRGLEKAGAEAVITCDAEEIASADGLVLPGVGAFHEGMEQLGPLKRPFWMQPVDVPCWGSVSACRCSWRPVRSMAFIRGLALSRERANGSPRFTVRKYPIWDGTRLTIDQA
ncbi:MAG: hypothetical protein MZV63_17400 [Marinilabiliales bacterium]|nr:hypothetical protein [Marinilabiliales bacterium]